MYFPVEKAQVRNMGIGTQATLQKKKQGMLEFKDNRPRPLAQKVSATKPEHISSYNKVGVRNKREIDLVVRRSSANNDVPMQLMKFYHGTTKANAESLAGGQKVEPVGKGELGGGFYLTHNRDQAGHIADYYCSKERRDNEWGVVEFDVSDDVLATLDRERIGPEEFDDYYEAVQEKGNDVESEHSWSYSMIKDGHTPYIQHLFAGEGIKILNKPRVTTRELVLTGFVGVDKDKYSSVREYDVEKDDFEDRFPEAVEYTDDKAEAGGDAFRNDLTKEEVIETAYSLINHPVNFATPDIAVARNLVDNATRLGDDVLEELAGIFDYADVGDTHREKIPGLRPWREWLSHPRPPEQCPK